MLNRQYREVAVAYYIHNRSCAEIARTQRISVEMGVSLPYLEEETDILLEYEVLQKSGEKLQTNILIFTEKCEQEVAETGNLIIKEAALQLQKTLDKTLPALKKLDFSCPNANDNLLRWVFANLTVFSAMKDFDAEQRERYGGYPSLLNGSYGFVFGYDNDCHTHHFNGIYGICEGEDKSAYITVVNYRVLEASQKWNPGQLDTSVNALTDAVMERRAGESNEMVFQLIEDGFIRSNGGFLSANFPVFSEHVLENDVKALLSPMRNIAKTAISDFCEAAEKIVKAHTPKHLHIKCGQTSAIHYQLDAIAYLVETMLNDGWLALPEPEDKPCMYGVKR